MTTVKKLEAGIRLALWTAEVWSPPGDPPSPEKRLKEVIRILSATLASESPP